MSRTMTLVSMAQVGQVYFLLRFLSGFFYWRELLNCVFLFCLLEDKFSIKFINTMGENVPRKHQWRIQLLVFLKFLKMNSIRDVLKLISDDFQVVPLHHSPRFLICFLRFGVKCSFNCLSTFQQEWKEWKSCGWTDKNAQKIDEWFKRKFL